MKKWGLWLVFVFLIGCEANHPKQEVSIAVQSPADISSVASHTLKILVAQDQVYQGNLVLVNQDYPIHRKTGPSDVVNLYTYKELVKGYGLLDRTIQLPRSLLQSFQAMVDAAGQEGVNHFLISSGYRDNAEQSKLYKEKGSDYALPAGRSEHNLGLSLDIGSTLKAMSQAPEGEWLRKNAWNYGFILRYPKDKIAITGIQYEPWHYRYVGLPHSRIMQTKNLTLEQYLDYLKEQKKILVTVDKEKYEIFYVPVSKTATIQVPSDHPYALSGNNQDGVIVTVHL